MAIIIIWSRDTEPDPDPDPDPYPAIKDITFL